MRIYEKMFVGKQDTENVENKVNMIQKAVEFTFKEYKETKSRIERLNESKIMEIK